MLPRDHLAEEWEMATYNDGNGYNDGQNIPGLAHDELLSDGGDELLSDASSRNLMREDSDDDSSDSGNDSSYSGDSDFISADDELESDDSSPDNHNTIGSDELLSDASGGDELLSDYCQMPPAELIKVMMTWDRTIPMKATTMTTLMMMPSATRQEEWTQEWPQRREEWPQE
jgi:hypothetical protein